MISSVDCHLRRKQFMYSEDILINNLKVGKKKLQVAEDKLTILDLKSFDSSCALFCFLIKNHNYSYFHL
jgi:hypothetical protein